MTERKDFLLEIGAEELPPKALRAMSEALTAGICAGLEGQSLTFESATTYATPRRLAVLVSGLPLNQPDREFERRGPALQIAFDENGAPTKAAQGFARGCGVDVEQLEKAATDDGGGYLVYRTTDIGAATTALLPAIIDAAVDKLPVPKRMRWANSEVEFSRPVHWIVMLFGDEVVPAQVLGISAGRMSSGHRFHCPELLAIEDPASYATLLQETGHVMPELASRAETIRAQVEQAAKDAGGEAIIDDALIEEVASLVEWPVAVLGSFEPKYLDLPDELLIATMQGHQRYFPVRGPDGNLLAHFITISNIDSHNPDAVREGNERVIRPRLSDAAFFFETDLATPLEARQNALKGVVFQTKLGTVHDKAMRISRLAGHLAIAIGEAPDNVKLARRAGELCKFDLMSEMVGEFPELQGVMGREYALKAGEPEAVAHAIGEVYRPRFARDDIPKTGIGRAIAIADKLDSLVGIFGIGQAPTGDKDPYALRRAALGVLRIIIEGELNLELPKLIDAAIKGYGELVAADGLAAQIEAFMLDRLRAYFGDQGVPATVFAAVQARNPRRPHDFSRRIQAVNAFRALPESEGLAAANKRIQNILRQVDTDVPVNFDDTLFVDDSEWNLAAKLVGLGPRVREMLKAGDYTGAMTTLARLREAIDEFFEAVKVMDDNVKVKNNRLALLNTISDLFLATADISRLQE